MIDLASGRCCSDVWTSSSLSIRHCGASGRFQRPVWTVALEPVVLPWIHEYFQDACDQSHALTCTLSEYMKILNLRADNSVKLQPLHKVFLFIQNVANIKY
jgi:hypothetical protein